MNIVLEVKHAVRGLFRSPGYTFSAVVTLALGIGVASAVLDTAKTTLRQPLPFRDPDHLVVVTMQLPELGLPRAVLSQPFIQDLQEVDGCFESLLAYGRQNMNLTGVGEPERLAVARVSAGATEVLGVDLHLGRDFSMEEDLYGGPRAALLSHALWQRRFGGDPGILGETLTLDGNGYTVTGVLPAGMRFPVEGGLSADAWIPLAFEPKEQSRGYHDFTVVARLAPGIPVSRLSDEADVLKRALMERSPGDYDHPWSLNLDPIRRELVRDVRGALLLLQGAVAFVLLIACFNVSNLLLARFSSRSRELAIRRVLGRSAFASLRPILAESLVLAVVGGLAGLLVAMAVFELFARVAASRLPQLVPPRVDGSLALLGVALIVLCAVLVSLLPVWWAGTRGTGLERLVGGVRGGRSRRTGRILGAVMVAEIGLALVMLVGAGLFVRSLDSLLRLDPGFDTDGVYSVRLSAPASRYEDMAEVHRFFGQVLDQVRAVPGVDAAGGVSALPLAGMVPTSSFQVEGRPPDGSGSYPHTHFTYAMDGYFRTMGIELIQGRGIGRQDTETSLPVVVVNEAFARAYWSQQSALGKRIAFVEDGTPEWREVVGVTADVHLTTESPEAEPIFYLPVAQRPFGMDSAFELSLVVRSQRSPQDVMASLNAALAKVDPDQPLYDLQTVDQLLAGSISARRLVRDVLSGFALIAVVLAAVGVYGVVAFVTEQRRHEIGIRLAVGARPGDVAETILRRALMATAMGLGLGLVGAFAASQGLRGLLYSVGPTDPATYLTTALLLGIVSLVACLVPALRAAGVDPVEALRNE